MGVASIVFMVYPYVKSALYTVCLADDLAAAIRLKDVDGLNGETIRSCIEIQKKAI